MRGRCEGRSSPNWKKKVNEKVNKKRIGKKKKKKKKEEEKDCYATLTQCSMKGPQLLVTVGQAGGRYSTVGKLHLNFIVNRDDLIDFVNLVGVIVGLSMARWTQHTTYRDSC